MFKQGLWKIVAAVVLATGCAGGDNSGGTAATIGGGTDTDPGDESDDVDPDAGETGDESDVCLLQNCGSDLECAGCTEGRNTCYEPDRRCVACDPDSGEGCDEGEKCTEFGDCVPSDLECPMDADGVPTIACDDDPDCAACDPLHQVCAAGQCVACRGDMEEACQTTEHCEDNECVTNCPESCTADAACALCGEGTEKPAPACKNHQCAQCSDTTPCPSGQQCTDRGTCIDICGIPGQIPGTCEDDADCAGCEGDNTNCVAPINGGHGTCGPEASGCSDLGEGVVVLPEPYDQVTNACSDDGDCEGIGILYNVGELLRDLTGIEAIDDANIEYPMSRCADVTVGVGETSISCGICVPCKVDDDCQDIDIDEVAGDAFGPLGAIATALLLDSLFGDNEHTIFMFCQPVAGEFGVCAPCPTLINDCVGGGGGGGGGSGSCDHDVCTEGEALDPSCGSCAASICAIDGFCCENSWDATCVGHVEDECAAGCGGGGGSGCHDQCEEGDAMDPSCNACVSAICAQDPFCCQTAWDDVCVGQVASVCSGECAGTGCAHDECQQGGPLDSGCSSCASDVCAADSFCCNVDWDSQCVDEADAMCGGCGASCAHDECQEGGPLESSCSSCASEICGADPFCCATAWDDQCVDAALDATSCTCFV